MAALTKNDYKTVLEYYGISTIGIKNKKIRAMALDILANKLCRCIKKIGDDKKAIAICKDSVLNKKGLKNGIFTCKKTPQLLTDKLNKSPLVKTRKRLPIKHKRKKQTRTRRSRVNKVKRRK